MPVELTDNGTGNRLELHPWFQHYGRLKITFNGGNSSVRINQPPATCAGTIIQIGSNCSIEIGARCGLANAFIGGSDGMHVSIGEATFFTSRPRFVMNEPARVTIGRDCLIAADTTFMTSDSHTVFDVATNRRINPSADIVVEDHVWIGVQCFILKGARIGHNSVVGLRSVVTRDVPPHCLVAGTPARVIRTGVDWDRNLWATEPESLAAPTFAEPAPVLRAASMPRWWQRRRPAATSPSSGGDL